MGAIADAVGGVERLGRRDVARLAAVAVEHAEPGGFAGPALAGELQHVAHGRPTTAGGRGALQDLLARLGVTTELPIELPVDDTPYWLRGDRPLAGHRSQPTLAGVVDVLIIGAG